MKRILVIEDDDLLRGLLKAALRREGFQVFVAGNGAEGIKLYDQISFDLVITDILMPDQEGLQTIRELLHKNPDAIIVAMSGGGKQVGVDVLEIAQRFGATATVQKPFEVPEMLRLIKKLLERTAST
jgi:DNA-binding response OmpR family regulator